MTADLAPILGGLREIAARFDVAICDIWGVVHNGVAATSSACDALSRFRAGGGTVILVSNAPRPSITVVDHLDALGVPRTAWDGIVTSGDVTRRLLLDHARGRPGLPVQHFGPQRDAPLFTGLPIALVGAEAADVIVCTGLYDDETETPDDYALALGSLAARRLPMLCANPDRVVERGNRLLYCAGALADAYAALGGPVVYCGKPHPPVYDAARAVAEGIRKAPVRLDRVIAIGDSARTDLTGAQTVGVASLFIAFGIHGGELADDDGRLDPDTLDAFLRSVGKAPLATMPRLAW